MTIQENKELIRRFVEEVINGHNLEIMGEFAGDAPGVPKGTLARCVAPLIPSGPRSAAQ